MVDAALFGPNVITSNGWLGTHSVAILQQRAFAKNLADLKWFYS